MTQLLQRILPTVQKPARYTGGEYNEIQKDKSQVRVRVAFCFPDTYEIGMSNVGMRILYGVMNQMDGVWCERVFAPWADMEEAMRRRNLPLWALESQDPVRDFDMIAFTVGYEMSYSNIVNMLNLAGVPLYAKDRQGLHNMVFAGGVCTFAQREKVYKVSQRLRVKGADTAGKDHVVQAEAVFGIERHTGQIQHVHNIGIAHLIADGKGNHVKILDRVLAFQRPQGERMPAHGFFHICPGGKYPLAPDTVHLVHDTVEDPHTHIGHADLIGIREAVGHPYPDLGLVFLNFVIFTAGISGGFLHSRQNTLK